MYSYSTNSLPAVFDISFARGSQVRNHNTTNANIVGTHFCERTFKQFSIQYISTSNSLEIT